jgi:hypothetical protein
MRLPNRTRHFADAGALWLLEWIETLPPFARPIANGGLLVVILVLIRGIIVLPLLCFYLLFLSHAPLVELVLTTQAIGLAILGGALSGLSYSAIGRHLTSLGRPGRYAAGIATIAPYIFACLIIERLLTHERVFARLETFDWALAGGLSVLFGVVMGEFWFGNDVPPSPREEGRTVLKLLGGGAILFLLAWWYASP